MDKNGFRVTSILKIIIKICKKNVEFYAKTSKLQVFTQKMSVHFLYFLFFYLHKEEMKSLHFSTSHQKKKKKKKKKEVDQKHQKHF